MNVIIWYHTATVCAIVGDESYIEGDDRYMDSVDIFSHATVFTFP